MNLGMSRRSSPPHAIGTTGVTDATYEGGDLVNNPLAPVVHQGNQWYASEEPSETQSQPDTIPRPKPQVRRASNSKKKPAKEPTEVRMVEISTPHDGEPIRLGELDVEGETPDDMGYDTEAQERVYRWRTCFEEPTSSRGAKVLSFAVLGVICVSTLGLIIETEPTFDNTEDKYLSLIHISEPTRPY
eukprot:TRINITY_DN2609_c0_g1_i1.p1 TRINITY_DN2609_c0_g1~~TRINITY_DN2609_c0_g1_i1.p1  ORF type:complete len:187 (-),score=47.07 TRINITY_DN2609_c0_g1_i1:90-650(-)